MQLVDCPVSLKFAGSHLEPTPLFNLVFEVGSSTFTVEPMATQAQPGTSLRHSTFIEGRLSPGGIPILRCDAPTRAGAGFALLRATVAFFRNEGVFVSPLPEVKQALSMRRHLVQDMDLRQNHFDPMLAFQLFPGCQMRALMLLGLAARDEQKFWLY
jgi:hypothetical protein